MTNPFYLMKSKKTGKYFRFVKYCDDGYGEYLADIEEKNLFRDEDEVPHVISEYQYSLHLEGKLVMSHIRGHELEGVEFVSAKCIISPHM